MDFEETGNEHKALLLQRLIAGGMEWALILLPVMIYLLFIGLWLNWRRTPLMVSGPKSMFGLLFALSGFFLIGPPSWIVHYFRNSVEPVYWLAYASYAGLLLLVSGVLLFRQRRATVIYNVEPELFAEVLQEALVEQQIAYSATPGRISLNDSQAVLDIETFPLLSNITLRWRGAALGFRRAIEEAVARKLAESPTTFNLTSGLLTLIAGFLLIFIYFATDLYLHWNYWQYTPPPLAPS